MQHIHLNKNKNLEKYTKVANNYYDIYNLFFIGTLINWISSNLTLNILIVMLFIFGMFFVVALIKYEFEANTNQVSKSKWWYSFLKDVLANIMIAFLLGIFANTYFSFEKKRMIKGAVNFIICTLLA